MLSISPSQVPSPDFTALFDALRAASTAPEVKGVADKLAREVSKSGPQSLLDADVLKKLHNFATNKKSGYERESAAIAFQSLALVLGPPIAPLLLPSLPLLFELYMDKGDVVRKAAAAAVNAILKLFPPEAFRILFTSLESILQSGKWRTKVGVLDSYKSFVALSQEAVAEQLGRILPKVELSMHDTKQEVSVAANKCATVLCSTIGNPDVAPHLPILVKCMADPNSVPSCIKALSSTTFVAEVKAPTLAVLVPLLLRALNDRSMEVQRRTVVVIDNLVKLVRDPSVAAMHLSPLVEGVQKIAAGASFPEVRAFAETALHTLMASGASVNGPPASHWDLEKETTDTLSTLISRLPESLLFGKVPKFGMLIKSLEFQAALVVDLIANRTFDDSSVWDRCVGVYMSIWLDREPGEAFAESVRLHYRELDQSNDSTAKGSSNEGKILCDTIFSLAYGSLLLLSHTTLRLLRGRRYGILGANGSGKSTLLRQLKEGKVENFPPPTAVKCVMVEHSLQGEDTSQSVIDFIASDAALANIPRSKIREQLLDVGFDGDRQADIVGGLSGGWKMKLELARAMLYNADLLLLDEPTNHLDSASVKWLEHYLMSHSNVTCLIVSHDSGFLDNVVTDIIHYESKKLVYYSGNLSSFVERYPEAKSYYTLAATSVKFSFPHPGSLMGVRSNTRAILRLSNCTFTYPGKSKPSLYNVSCALSLSSRVGVVGPNGAGKSTLIKLLTGETIPQEGSVDKHPSLRVGYVSQHATHHIERHLEKTPISYIQWRFQDGHDREVLEKESRVLTEEEERLFDLEWIGKDGSKRKLELLMGRQKFKKSLQYEVKWRGLDHKFNTWVSREDLIAKGFSKIVQRFDDLEASREGASARDTATSLVRRHLEQIGLDGDIAQYNEISGLSGGQKIKLVIAACLWNNPQICILDEPSNFLDREALGGLAVAIKEWAGAVVIVSHNSEFISTLCPEVWNVEAGHITHRGKGFVEDAPLARAFQASGVKTPVGSRLQSPVPSSAGTPVASGDETSMLQKPGSKKKKMTRNQLKAQEERRRLRKLRWLSEGGPRPEDTEEE